MSESELIDVRGEIQDIKRALRSGGSYLGMQGETLTTYFLELTKKENIIMAAQAQNGQAQVKPAVNSVGSYSKANYIPAATGGYRAEPLAPARPTPTSTDPSRPLTQFDKDDINSILAHLRDQEGNPREAARGLRAFSALAYKGPSKIGSYPESLSQVQRIMELHPEDDAVQLAAIRGICNVAHESSIARERLSDETLLSAIANAAAKNEFGDVSATKKELANQANETLARIVFAWDVDVGPVLRSLFGASTLGDDGPKQVFAKLLTELTKNEDITRDNVAVQLVATMDALWDIPVAALRIFELLKQLCLNDVEQQTALINAGAIQATSSLMGRHVGDRDVQRAAIDAFSSLIGVSWDGLSKFATADGIPRIEAAMNAHPDFALMQIKGLVALASGIKWPEDMRRKAKYDSNRAITLTIAAMIKHKDDDEVALAGLDALSKYLERLCTHEIKANGGEDLVKEVMARHQSIEKVQSQGKIVLTSLRS